MIIYILAKICIACALCFIPNLTHADEPASMQESTPKYLYKILSLEKWQASKGNSSVQLPEEDADFIHFSREDQLERITSKYWSHIPSYVILKIDTTKLRGEMRLEANPGGSSKYYHLYNGSIPIESVVESRTIENNI